MDNLKMKYLPNELVNIIFEYDGRIKYRKGQWINILHKYDTRYQMLEPIYQKKRKTMEKIVMDGSAFYFEVELDDSNQVGLCYDYHWMHSTVFEICYYDFRKSDWKQLRTVI